MNLKALPRAGALLAIVLTFFALTPQRAAAQEEGEPVVVDEVIAQVNNDVVTLSMVRREIKEMIEQMKSQRVSEQEATAKANGAQNEIIVNLINEQLLVQKGKELNMTEDVEAEVNKRLLQIAREQGIDTIEKLDAALTASGLNPAQLRQTMRTEMMKNMVFNNEVDRRVYFGLSPEEVKAYYEANKDKFRRPESVELSEIFLSLAGKSETEVRARAAQIVAQARAVGADFGALAVANSEREQNGVRTAPQSKGKLGRVQLTDIGRPEVTAALNGVKSGGVTDPIKLDEGILILRVDDRTGSSEPTYSENRARELLTMERAEKERKAFIETLRNEAFIKIAKDYEAALKPLLNLKAPATASNEDDEKKSEKDKKQPEAQKENKQP